VWTAATAVVMFALASGKARTGAALGNPVLTTEGRVTLVDGLLAVAVLAGLIGNAAAGWWWADPVAGYVLLYYAARGPRHPRRAALMPFGTLRAFVLPLRLDSVAANLSDRNRDSPTSPRTHVKAAMACDDALHCAWLGPASRCSPCAAGGWWGFTGSRGAGPPWTRSLLRGGGSSVSQFSCRSTWCSACSSGSPRSPPSWTG
jgi:hypothetical protein